HHRGNISSVHLITAPASVIDVDCASTLSRPTVAKMVHNVLPQCRLSFMKNYGKFFIMFVIFIFGFSVGIGVLMLRKGANCDRAAPASVTMQIPVNNVQHEVNYTTENYGAPTVPRNRSGPRQDLPSAVNCVTELGMNLEKQILKQREELNTVGCQPTAHVLYVPELLRAEDALLDKKFEPQWLVVGRCLPSCSYCQLPRKCLPTHETQRNKTFVVFTIEDKKPRYHKRRVVEHTACSCQ
ncbi:hypothetical protein OTU49_006204, partial [Cherax quadricarinatus]